MKTPAAIIFALLFSLLLAMGCKEEPVVARYYIDPGSFYDSLYIEWVVAGSKERLAFEKADISAISTITSNNWVRLHSLMDFDPGQADALLPSRQLDSLFVYRFPNGQRELIYSGIDDADWSKEEGYLYTLQLRL